MPLRDSFDPWIYPTLQAGWTNFLEGYSAFGYRLDGDIVQLRGAVKPTTNRTLFVLPIGYRPIQLIALNAAALNTSNAWTFVTWSIQISGNINWLSIPSGNLFSLDGLFFPIS